MSEVSCNSPDTPTYSFVVPIYNDGADAHEFCRNFDNVFRDHLGISDISGKVELIFVNDGSLDNSAQELNLVCETWHFAKAICLSRNFGQHVALSCGYEHSNGDYVGSINVDMQDPPSELPKLLNEIQKDEADIVIGVRRKRRDPLAKRLSSLAFNYLIGKLTGYKIPLNMATVRVMNRPFVDAYNSLNEKSRFLPGLEGWLGFRREFIEIEHADRQKGKSSYNFSKRFLMALDSIISFSDLPLRMVVLAGAVIALVGFLLAVGLVMQQLYFTDMQPGYTSTVAAIVLFGGVQILVIGVSGLYIGRVLKEVQDRPLYIVQSKINFENGTFPDSSNNLKMGPA